MIKYHRIKLWGISWVITIILVFFILFAHVINTEAQTIDGNMYMKWPKEARSFYIAGICAGIGIGVGLSEKTDPALSALINHLNKMTVAKITAIVDKWIKEHPEKWHISMDQLFCLAFIDSTIK